MNVHIRAGGWHNKTKKEIEKQSDIKKEAKLKDTEKPSGMNKNKRLATLHSDLNKYEHGPHKQFK